MATFIWGEAQGFDRPARESEQVPALSVDIGKSGPVCSHFAEWDELRELYPALWNDVCGGHRVLTPIRKVGCPPCRFCFPICRSVWVAW
jgi:hypothetical protein